MAAPDQQSGPRWVFFRRLGEAIHRALAEFLKVPLAIIAGFLLLAVITTVLDYAQLTWIRPIREMLRERFSFDARAFGQPVALSEVIAAIHGVEGVKWVDIDALHRSDEPVQWHAVLAAQFPAAGEEELLPAELLTLDPAPLVLEVTL